MKNLFKVIIFISILGAGLLVLPSLLDKFLFFWLLLSANLVFTQVKLNKSPYLIALILITGSSIMFFLDPKQIRLVHYIYKPATWSFYFILLGVLGDFYHDYTERSELKK